MDYALREELIWLQDWDSADQLREAIAAWLHVYNNRRPHQALGWLTPSGYRAAKLGAALASARMNTTTLARDIIRIPHAKVS